MSATSERCKVLWCPHKSNPRIRSGCPKVYFDESLYLGPGISVLYDISKSTPNEGLSKFGGIFSNIPGDAVVIFENPHTGKRIDVPDDVLDKLPQILKNDSEQRIRFLREMKEMM